MRRKEMSHPQSSPAIVRGAAWSLLDNTARQILALVVFLVTARFVSVEDFGIMAVSLLIVEAFKWIVIESIGTAMVSSPSPDDEDYNASFMLILCTSLCSAALVFFGADVFAQLFNNAKIADALQMICLLLAFMGVSKTHEVWLSRHLRFKELALRSLLSVLAGGAVGITLAVYGYGLKALIAQQLVFALVSVSLLWLVTPWRPHFKTTRAKVWRLIHFAKHVTVTGFTSIVTTQSDIFFSSYYLGEVSTGIYNAAKRITFAINAILTLSLKGVALPVLSNMQEDNTRLGQAYLKAILFTSMLIAPAYAGIAVTAPDLIAILLGEKWQAAAPILSILTISSFLTSIGQYNHVIFLVKHKPHWDAILTGFYAATNVVLLIVFVRYGLHALAWAFTVRAIIFLPVSVGAALYLLKLPARDYFKILWAPLVATAVMFGTLKLIQAYLQTDTAFLNLLILMPSGVMMYAAMLYVFNKSAFQNLWLECRNAIASRS